MSIKNILEQCSELSIYEKRKLGDDYIEIVIFKADLLKWCQQFDKILGEATKPESSSPTDEDVAVTEEYGGVFDNQILYHHPFEEENVVILIWPWQDNVHTTVKIAVRS